MYMMVYFRCPSAAVGQSALADDLASEAPSEAAGSPPAPRPVFTFPSCSHLPITRLLRRKKHPPSTARACRGSEQADTFARVLTDL